MALQTIEREQFNIEPLLNPNHGAILSSQSPELLVYGGAGAGKSYSIADKLLLQPIIQPTKKLKALVIKKTFPSLRSTALDILIKRAETLHIPLYLNKAEWTAQVYGMKIHFQSLNNSEDYQKLKSMTDIDFEWINELPELRETDYDECLRRLRGGQSDYEQMVADFNPIWKKSWVFKRFFERNIGNVEKLRYTIMDNHPDYLKLEKTQRYIERLKATKDYNPNYYKIYFLGEWGELEGVIYDWDIVPEAPANPDEIFYGGDFGYSVDPAALARIYRKGGEFWLEEVIYETGLTNIQLAKKIKSRGVDVNADEYWDSAEPKSIEELKNEGLNAKPSLKGPDSVRAGIDFIKEQTVHIIDGSTNIINEQKGYIWKRDKDGNALNVPIGINDHMMSGIRYGIYTHCRGFGDFGFGTS